MSSRRRTHASEFAEQPEAELPHRPATGAPRKDPATRAHPLLGLQANAGNMAVRSLLDRSSGGNPAMPLQRLWDTEGETDDDVQSTGQDERPADGDTTTDDDTTTVGGEPAADESTGNESAQDESIQDGGDSSGAIDQVEAQAESDLDPGRVIATLEPHAAQGREMGDFETPSGDVAQALAIQRDPADGEAPAPRPGTPGDVLKALMPFLEPALERLKADVLATLRRLRTGEKIAVAIVIAPIVLAPLTQPGPRRFALDQLDGTDVTFGVIPNLRISPSISDGQLRGGTVTYDLAPALRSLGVPF